MQTESAVISKIKGPSILNKTMQYLRRIDNFGHPITLTYKGDSTFKSPLGGFFTLAVYAIVLSFFFTLLKAVIIRDNFTVTNTYTKRDIQDTSSILDLSIDNFEIALSARWINPLPNNSTATPAEYFHVSFKT